MRACSSGRLDGVSSTRIASRGRRSASACRTWPARSGSPGRAGPAARDARSARRRAGRGGRRRGGAGVSGASPGRPARVDARRQRGADRAGVAEHGQLDRAAVRLLRVLRDEREPSSSPCDERALVVRVLADRAGADDEHGVVAARASSRRRARRAGSSPANSGWSCGKPAWAPNGSWKTGQPSRSASAISAVHRRRRPAPATIAGRSRAVEHRRQRLDRAPGRRRGERSRRCGAEDLVRLRRGRRPVVHRHDHERRAAVRERGVVGADDRARHVLGARRLLVEDRVLPREPVAACRPGTGPSARWRRSCWPTTTTSGARFSRAVAIAATALPSPGVLCRSASAGRPEPSAWPIAIDTTEPSCSASTKRQVVGQAGQERDLGRARVGEDRRQLEPPQDVERGVAHRRHRARTVPRKRLKFSCERSTLALAASFDVQEQL